MLLADIGRCGQYDRRGARSVPQNRRVRVDGMVQRRWLGRVGRTRERAEDCGYPQAEPEQGESPTSDCINVQHDRGRAEEQDPSKYTEEDKEHMRKVVSYCKRHLAQEEHLKQDKGPEELEKSKSTRSLKNWVRCCLRLQSFNLMY